MEGVIQVTRGRCHVWRSPFPSLWRRRFRGGRWRLARNHGLPKPGSLCTMNPTWGGISKGGGSV